MKKISFYMAGVLFFGLLALSTNASAVDVTNTGTGGEAGDDVIINCSNTDGAADIKFSPSTNVWIDGQSDDTSFAIFGWHASVIKKSSGQAYGMAGDDNKLAFVDISTDMTILEASRTAQGTSAAVAFVGWTTI